MSTLTESSLSQDISGFHTFSPNSPASGSSSPHYGYSSYGRTPKFGKSSKKSPSNHKTLGYYSHNISPQTTPLKSDQSENYAYEYGLVNGYYYYFDGITFYGVPAPSNDENQIIEENKNNSPVKNNPEPPSTPIPLQNSWSFWFDKYLGPGLTLSEYETAMKNLGSFSTVQEFWKYYNNIPAASRLPPRTSYHMMKTGIKPLWEDESNMYGGSFSFRIPKEISDDSWLHTLLAVIGEQFDEGLNTDGGDDICGVSISRRREENVINIWHKTASLADKEKFSNFICKILSRVSPGFIPVVNYKVHQSEENFKSQSSPASK